MVIWQQSLGKKVHHKADIQKENVKNKQRDTSESKAYIAHKVNPIMEKMLVELMIQRPANPVPFMIKWLQEKGEAVFQQAQLSPPKKKAPAKGEENLSGEDDDDDTVPELPSKEALAKARAQKNCRTSVSAEAYGQFNKKSDFKPRVIPKTESQRERILKRLGQAFMFSSLDDSEKETVILAMEEKRFRKGDVIIRQYDDGDELYVVDAGEMSCYRKPKKDASEMFLKKYGPGDSFGELALLYNAPRAATIAADCDCILFALDRETFNHIVKGSAIKKREAYEGFLSRVEILDTMDPYERSKIADVLKPLKFAPGQYVVKEGEHGDCFFFLEEGQAVATKRKPDGSEQIVFEYKPGDYFGELALLRDTPRAASIVAKTELKVVSMDRLSFKRLLGPLDEILKRNFARYEKYSQI